MYLWLNEARIQTRDFDISQLPAEFDVTLLQRVMTEKPLDTPTSDSQMWLEYLDQEG